MVTRDVEGIEVGVPTLNAKPAVSYCIPTMNIMLLFARKLMTVFSYGTFFLDLSVSEASTNSQAAMWKCLPETNCHGSVTKR